MKKKLFFMAFVLASLAALFMGCMENPSSTDTAGDNTSSRPVLTITTDGSQDGKYFVDIIANGVPWGDNLPDDVSAVGLFGHWTWEGDAEATLKKDSTGSLYHIQTLAKPGVYSFNMKGKKGSRDLWSDNTIWSDSSEYWLELSPDSCWLVFRLSEDGDISTVSKSAMRSFLKIGQTQASGIEVDKLVESKGVRYGFDTLEAVEINGKSALISSAFNVVSNWPLAANSAFVCDTLDDNRYVVATKVVLDTTQSVKDTIYVPGDTLWLTAGTATTTKIDTVTIVKYIYDTIVEVDTIIRQSGGRALWVASYQADGAERGIYELAFRWGSDILGTEPFVKGVPDWNRVYSLGFSYGDTARGIKTSLIEGKFYSCGYGANKSGAWAFIPCDDPLAVKPSGSDYCQFEFIPWKGRLYTVEEYNIIKSVIVHDTIIGNTTHDTLYVDTSDGGSKIVIINTSTTDTVYIDTTKKGVKYVYIDTSKFVVMYKDSLVDDEVIYIDTSTSPGVKIIFVFGDSTSIDTSEVVSKADTTWKDTVLLAADTGITESLRYLRNDSLLIERSRDSVRIEIVRIIVYSITDGDTDSVAIKDTLSKPISSTSKKTVDLTIVVLKKDSSGNIYVGAHEKAFSDTVSDSALVMVGNPTVGKTNLNWSPGIKSTKEGRYFSFKVALKEGEILPQFNFRHSNGSWAVRDVQILEASPLWVAESGFAGKLVNGELIPLK